MSNVLDQPGAQGPAHPESQSPLPGAGFPAGPGVPPGADGGYGGYGGPGGGYGGYGGPGGPRRRRHRVLKGVAAAGVAFAAGAGVTAWAAGGPGSTATSNRELSTESIVQMTDPAVVDVVSTLGDQGAESAGTGIVLTSSGEVLTNNHVIDGATSIKVTEVGDGQTYSATVVGYDATHDIAVLKLKGASGLKTATIGNSASVSTGQKIVALGNAGGRGGSPSVAAGWVTGLGKSITAVDQGTDSSEQLTNMIKTNADIQAGDSGGPLTSTAGQVIGIDTAALSAGSETATASVQAFAIPINRAVSIADKIEAGQGSGTVHVGATAFLGVSVEGSEPGGATGSGATIGGVVPGTAAARAGLGAGDVIVSLGGHAVTSSMDLRNLLTTRHPGDTVSVSWQDQSGQTQSANVVLGSGPAA
jgi:S1-C subfamily serine protease